MQYKTPGDLIKSSEISYQSQGVTVAENYDWSMYKHILTSFLYLNSTYLTGKKDDKPFKNITLPMLNLQFRAEGFDLKDIVLYVNDAINYFKSFLIRKWHDKWARENNMDTFIDSLVESYVVYGGALVKKADEPEVVPLQRLAFCDQTDILAGPICEKHYYSIDQLKEMESKGWDNIDEAISHFLNKKDVGNQQTDTAGSYIEVYELHGIFPTAWLEGGEPETDEYDFTRQLHIITFYKDSDDKKQALVLFSGKEKDNPYKFLARDPIYGRALGRGGAEELVEAQVWTNYDIIRITEMLDMASKMWFQTTDKKFANKNKTKNLSNGEILVVEDGKSINPIDNVPRNLNLFNDSVARWEQHAQQIASASDAILGESPTSGTPFRLQALVTQEAHSLHIYRRGKIATFLDEIYRDWIIPQIVKEVAKGDEWLAELDNDEMVEIADMVANSQANKAIKEKVLSGEIVNTEDIDLLKQQTKDEFVKGGGKKFLEILKDEFKNISIDVYTNIAGKQADLPALVDKLTNVFRTIAANPQILQNPGMAKLLNQILENSGLNPIDYASLTKPIPQQAQPTEQQQQQQPVANNIPLNTPQNV